MRLNFMLQYIACLGMSAFDSAGIIQILRQERLENIRSLVSSRSMCLSL